jgi:hypothetical protein
MITGAILVFMAITRPKISGEFGCLPYMIIGADVFIILGVADMISRACG